MKTIISLTLLLGMVGFANAQTNIVALSGTAISAAHSGTLYMGLPGNITNATEANVQTYANITGTISNLLVGASAPGGSDTIVVTIDKNTTGQTLTCTVSAAGTTCADATHSFTVVPTDLLSVSLVFSTAVTGRLAISVEATTTAGTNGHVLFTGSAPTLSLCGTSPTVTNGTDNGGVVTLGTGTVNACTLTFATAFTNTPACNVDSNSNVGQPWVSAVSTTAVTFTMPYTGASKLYYSCF